MEVMISLYGSADFYIYMVVVQLGKQVDITVETPLLDWLLSRLENPVLLLYNSYMDAFKKELISESLPSKA